MKSKILFAVIPFLLALVSCAPVSTPAPTNTPAPTAAATSTPISATPTHESTSIAPHSNISISTPFARENASEDCFFTIDFIPEKTEMSEVIFAWGTPSEKWPSGGDFEVFWYFDFVGTPRVSFNKLVLDRVIFLLENCSLEKIIAKLGPPEKVEITVLVSDIDLSESYIQNFHFTSLGFAYFRSCDETEDCFTFQANDIVGGKEFYSPDKTIEDSTGFNTSGYVYDWHGFDVDVEKVEDRIR